MHNDDSVSVGRGLRDPADEEHSQAGNVSFTTDRIHLLLMLCWIKLAHIAAGYQEKKTIPAPICSNVDVLSNLLIIGPVFCIDGLHFLGD